MHSAVPCWEYFFSGRVQGVGFRYTAQRLAEREGLVGTVENLPDGRVRLCVLAAEPQIESFLEQLTTAMQGQIAHFERRPLEPSADWRGFRIIR